MTEQPAERANRGDKECPECGNHVYSGSYNGTRVYRCASPISSCDWNAEWHDEHGDDEYRMPLGTTIAQVRRVNAEFNDRVEA